MHIYLFCTSRQVFSEQRRQRCVRRGSPGSGCWSTDAAQSHLPANIHSRRRDAFRNNIVAHFPLLVSLVNCVHTRGGRRLVCLLCLQISSSCTLSIIIVRAAAASSSSSPSMACFYLSLLVPSFPRPSFPLSLSLSVCVSLLSSPTLFPSQLSTLLSAPFAFSTLTIHPFGARSLPST